MTCEPLDVCDELIRIREDVILRLSTGGINTVIEYEINGRRVKRQTSTQLLDELDKLIARCQRSKGRAFNVARYNKR